MKSFQKFLSIVFLIIPFTISAQENLKGNRVVTTEARDISNFNKIEVIDDFDVQLVYNDVQSVSVETDSNLQEAIITEIIDGKLIIKTSAKIVRKKELKIHIKVNNNLKEINAYNNASIKSNNVLNIDSLTINAFDKSNFDLKLIAKNIHINGKKTSDLKFDILCDAISAITEESCSLKANIDAKNTEISGLDKSTITVKGTTETLEIEAYGYCDIKGKEFVSKKAYLDAYNASDIFINTTEALEIKAKNSAQVYIFSNPKITLTEFFDKATLYKRELENKLF